MTDEKYIENQKSFIKREQKFILRDHFHTSVVLLLLFAFVIFVGASFEHPSKWKETTITLQSYKRVNTGKGDRLDIYDTNGNRYAINRNESAINAQLIVGQQYTFTYSNNIFHDIVEVLEIDDTEYLNYDSALKNYRGTKILFWVFSSILFALLVFINFFIYQTSSYDRKKRIQKYKKRIKERYDQTK